ncbi:MAG: tRNA (N(6)-L-threonylcarbamoyladenosine(37)-C(2))-methylthiotransferase MtaB [Sphingomonadales bacterium]|nr:tRNA (N(6)-L-threonylcarbamoyladenosine(37)-C(2))-methylthiotransferase MtaB [Sphingomonadales bacterium]
MSAHEVVTLGCRLNIAESEAIARTLADAPDRSPVVVINSCAVTAEAVRRTGQAVRRARRADPAARIVVTGCAAQIEPDRFAAMAEVDAVVGNSEKARPASWLDLSGSARVRVGDIMAVRETAPQMAHAYGDRTRAFVEVQNGCDHRCTFCVIPYGRGNSRSVPAGAVVDRIAALVDEGHREIVLTGVDVTSYGHDLPGEPTLGSLVGRILNHVPALARLRLSSLDSIEIDDELFDLVTGEPRMMPHLHLSLQAGDDMILKRMKRRHSRGEAIAMVERLKARRPGIAIGADIIAGFPTESEAMFANSLRLVEECDIVFGHIFPFSPREGTPAARMPQLDRRVIKDRAAALRAACGQQRSRWLESLVATTHSLLVESDGRSGHLENFAAARLAAGSALTPGTIADVAVTAIAGATLSVAMSEAAE